MDDRPQAETSKERDRSQPIVIGPYAAAGMVGTGALLFSVSGVAFTGLVLAWFMIVLGSLAMLAYGLRWSLERLAEQVPFGGGGPIAFTSITVTCVAAWSVWVGMGPPSEGTLAEAMPALVDPSLAAVFALAARTKSERRPALVFVVAAAFAVLVVARAASVAPSYAPS